MKEIFRRRRLPHWDKPGAIYFVTSCLAGSIPTQGMFEINRYRKALAQQPCPEDLSESDWKKRQWKQAFVRCEEWLDKKPAVRHLEQAALAEQVIESLCHFAGTRYSIWAFVVMPSHFHWVFEPDTDWVTSLGDDANKRPPRERIMHSVKLNSARECNRLLGSKGTFWQDESYDHCVDDVDELQRIIEYIEQNPVKAGLCDEPVGWRFSSAHYRKQHGLEFGCPIIGRTDILT